MKKTGTDKTCENCGLLFHVPNWKIVRDQGQFCSMKCMWAGRKLRQKRVADVICDACGNPFTVPAFRKGKAKFCSNVCSGRMAIIERQRKNVIAAKGSQRGLRNCKKCKQEKPLSEFEPRRDSPDGYRFECRTCYAIKRVKWLAGHKSDSDRRSHQKHRPSRIAKQRKRYYENHAAIRAQRKQWAKDHPEETRMAARRNRENHGERLREKRRQDYRDNQPRYVAAARAREKRIKQATPPWADLKAIEGFYYRSAELSLKTGIKHHVDHIYPLKSPHMCGLHVETNLQILPAKVNLRKSNRIEEVTGEPLCCAWPTFLPEPMRI